MGHILLFALGAYFASKWIKRIKNLSYFKQVFLVTGLTILIGGVIEIVQPAFNRQCNINDIIFDIYGSLMFYAFFAYQRFRIKKKWRLSFQFFVFLLLINAGVPFIKFVVDEAAAKRNFPVLSDFETVLEKERWSSSSDLSIDNNFICRGKSLKARLLPAEYSSVSLDYFPSDWRGFKFLRCSLFNTRPEKIKINIRIHDNHHNKNGFEYKDRYNGVFYLKHGWNDIQINLDDILCAPLNRKMDISQIDSVLFFISKLKQPLVLYFDDIMLVKDEERTKAYLNIKCQNNEKPYF